MSVLILGLIIFLGAHSVRIFADDWRTKQIRILGEMKWKGIYSVFSILGLGLIIIGWGLAKQHNVVLWVPPAWTWRITAGLNLVASILLTAAYIPRNAIKTKLQHPMILGVKTWAFAHLISNGFLSGVVLFGAFLFWAVLCFNSSRSRNSNLLTAKLKISTTSTAVTVIVGVMIWVFMALYAHQAFIGIKPII